MSKLDPLEVFPEAQQQQDELDFTSLQLLEVGCHKNATDSTLVQVFSIKS